MADSNSAISKLQHLFNILMLQCQDPVQLQAMLSN